MAFPVLYNKRGMKGDHLAGDNKATIKTRVIFSQLLCNSTKYNESCVK